MLEVLRHQQVEGALATVVRYFGGVKLGAGGLVRAYTDAVAQALLGADARAAGAPAQPRLLGALRARRTGAARTSPLPARCSTMCSTATTWPFAFSLPEPDADAFITRLDDAAQGRVVWPKA